MQKTGSKTKQKSVRFKDVSPELEWMSLPEVKNKSKFQQLSTKVSTIIPVSVRQTGSGSTLSSPSPVRRSPLQRFSPTKVSTKVLSLASRMMVPPLGSPEDGFSDDESFVQSPSPSSGRRQTVMSFNDREALAILNEIQNAQQKRKQEHISLELRAIHERIDKTFQNFAFHFQDEDAPQDGSFQLPPVFDAKAEREKMEHRNYMFELFERYADTSDKRKQLLLELQYWFQDNEKLDPHLLTDTEMNFLIRESQELHSRLLNSLYNFEDAGDRVVVLGTQLLEETSKIVQERRAMLAKRPRKERMVVYDDRSLLADALRWESAVKMVVGNFEEATKVIRNQLHKNALMMGKKQFEYLMMATDKRLKELDEKKKQCFELLSNLNRTKHQCEKLSKEVSEERKKASKLGQDLDLVKKELSHAEEKAQQMKSKIVEMTSKIKFLEGVLLEKERVPTPPTPPPPPEPEKIYIKVVDSSTELQLKAVEEELEKCKAELESLREIIKNLEENLQVEKENALEMKNKIQELEQREPEIVFKTPDIVVPEPSPETMSPANANYYKTLMAGMKKEYEMELEKVKSHVKKEKMRSIADVRRLETEQKDRLNSLHKDIMRMLRAIVHFRDQMITVLEKENLLEAVQSLEAIGSLVDGKMSSDPKELLAVVVTNVVEYLHNMEGILANAFLALKVMLKYQHEKVVQREVADTRHKKVVKDIKKRKKVLGTAGVDVKKMAKQLKKAKNKLKVYERSTKGMLGVGDGKYRALLQRYRQVWNLYKHLQKDMEMLQEDFTETIEKKLEERETLVIGQIKLQMKEQRALQEHQLKLTLNDQRQNLKILGRAYEENKISKELHSMATALIHKTLELPERKLRYLFEQYIAFRTVKESQVRARQVLSDEDLAIDVRRDMESYLGQISNKLQSSMGVWKDQMFELELEKKDLNKQIYKLFNEVLLETGLLLVHPLLKDSQQRETRAVMTIGRDHMRRLLTRGRRRVHGVLQLPPVLQGNSINIQPSCLSRKPSTSRWDPANYDRYSPSKWDPSNLQQRISSPFISHHRSWGPYSSGPAEPNPAITSPYVENYDINRTKIQATRSMIKGEKIPINLSKTFGFNISSRQSLETLVDVLPARWTYLETLKVL